MEDYPNEEIIEQYEQQLGEVQQQNRELNTAIQGNFFSQQKEQNLVHYQLDVRDVLEEIGHFLRGDMLETDDEGTQQYKGQTDEELVPMNKFGVDKILGILSYYLNRTVILSNLGEERIDNILYDLGNELNKEFYCNYEKMGLDSEQKQSQRNRIIMNILHIVEATLKRALGGKAQEGMYSQRFVTQNEALNPQRNMGNGTPIAKSFNVFKPSTW